MKLRTKLFITWSSMVLALWGGTLWAVHRAVDASFSRVASDAFMRTRRGLIAFEIERMRRMQQAGKLVMNIPELRALIAEDSVELSEENRHSLAERLDDLAPVVGAELVAVVGAGGTLIESNRGSPWGGTRELGEYIKGSETARALITRAMRTNLDEDTGTGLWVHRNRLYQVVAEPLRFNADSGDLQSGIDGMILLASQVSNRTVEDIARAQNCQMVFLSGGTILASSLNDVANVEFQSPLSQASRRDSFVMDLPDGTYRCSAEPLSDPASDQTVGELFVLVSQAEGDAARASITRVLVAILAGGIFAAACASYGLSAAVTAPISLLVGGVKRVASGDLTTSMVVSGGEEISTLSAAFNDMVSQIRTRRQLELVVEATQAATRAKSQFLANISHEIRTPLNGVVGMAELLLTTQLTDRQRRFAELLKTSAGVLTTLINDLLDFSKMEAGKMELEAIEFDLRCVIEDVAAMMAPRVHAKGLEIVCDIDESLPAMFRGDPNRVRQILMNLVNNALKFTHEGEIVLSAAAGESAPVRISVRDTGIGIPPDRLDRLFRSFSQVDASTTRKYGGTGLGLAICKQLVELMGGGIGVKSSPGQGSEFWFTLALTVERENAPGELPPSLRGIRVLVADSCDTANSALVRCLRSIGLDAMDVRGGEAAVAVLSDAASRGTPFAFALLAEADRGITGIEVAKIIHARKELTGIKVLLLARAGTSAEPGHVNIMRDAGICGFISKPVGRAELLDALLAESRPHASAQKVADVPSRSTRREAKILLAEDNDVNQIVVCEMLANAGFTCDTASDGKTAAQAAERTRYDIILMDCQMPELDGFEATQIIRSSQQERGVRPSAIIALTANAAASDRQRCIEAGMDAYCTKPIEPERLLAAIDQCLAAGAGPNDNSEGDSAQRHDVATGTKEPAPVVVQGSSQSAALAAGSSAAFDLAALVRRCSGKPELATRVIERLLLQTREGLSSVQACVTKRDCVGIAKLGHSMKGSAGMAGADSLRAAAAKLEQAGRDADIALAAAAIEEVRTQLARCEEEFVSGRACGDDAGRNVKQGA